jgi:serine/threonine-protein kinase
MEALREGQVLTRYRIEARLGAGAMADVYLARHVDLGVQRAIKVLKRTDGDIRQRLLQEGRLQANLLHPNVVPVLEVIRVAGHPALIMDFVDGPALDVLLRRDRLTLEQLDVLARGILDGMSAAHGSNVVHRDLKPGNVMIDVRHDPPRARVADFGMAKAVTGTDALLDKTASNVMMGTPHYMAPEQFRDAKNVDHRADVWSLGVMLYEMVTGTLPFQADSAYEIFRLVEKGDYTPVLELNPSVPMRMVEAIEAALDPDLEDRCADVHTLRRLWIGDAHTPPSTHWNLDALKPLPEPLEKHDGSMEPMPGAGGVTLAPASQTAKMLQRSQRRIGLLAIATAVVSVVALLTVAIFVVGLGALGIGGWLARVSDTPGQVAAAVDEPTTDDGTAGEATDKQPSSPARPVTIGDQGRQAPGSEAPSSPPPATSIRPNTTLVPAQVEPAVAKPAVVSEPAARPPSNRYVRWTRTGYESVRLRAIDGPMDGQNHDPGDPLLAGVTYAIEARWPRRSDWVVAKTYRTVADQDIDVFCNQNKQQCSVR